MMKSNRKKWHAFNALSTVNWKQDEAALAKPMSSPWLLLMSCQSTEVTGISFSSVCMKSHVDGHSGIKYWLGYSWVGQVV